MTASWESCLSFWVLVYARPGSAQLARDFSWMCQLFLGAFSHVQGVSSLTPLGEVRPVRFRDGMWSVLVVPEKAAGTMFEDKANKTASSWSRGGKLKCIDVAETCLGCAHPRNAKIKPSLAAGKLLAGWSGGRGT